MFIRILRILAQLEKEIRPDLPTAVLGGFYRRGLEKMREYLSQFEVDAEALDNLADLVQKFYSEGDSLDDAAERAAVYYVDMNMHWKDVAESQWFDDIQALVRQSAGYVDPGGSGQFSNLPANLTYLQKQQIAANEQEIKQAILDGLETAEVTFLEDAIRSYFREYSEGYAEPEPKQETKPEVEEVEEKEEVVDFIQEPEDAYSGRFAHAVV